MGQFTFELPDQLTTEHAKCIQSCWLAGGYDLSPTPVRKTEHGNTLTLFHEEKESGFLGLPWPMEHGEYIITTSTLRPDHHPYILFLELSRGAVNRLRNFQALLLQVGIAVSPDLVTRLQTLTKQFGKLIFTLSEANWFEQTQVLLKQSLQLADAYSRLLSQYRFKAQRESIPPQIKHFGCRLTRPLSTAEQKSYLETFNAVRIVPMWNRFEPKESVYSWTEFDELVEWAKESKIAVYFGPIFDLADGPFPNWILPFRGDLPNLTAFLCDHLETILGRYGSVTEEWQLFHGMNHQDSLQLHEDDRLRLAARLLQACQEFQPNYQWTIGLSQPWGDYLASDSYTYSPSIFADTLIRGGFRVAGIELEFLSGPTSRSVGMRDALDTITLLELYDQFGLMMDATIGYPINQSEPNLTIIESVLSAPSVRSVFWENWSTEQSLFSSASNTAIWNSGATTALESIQELTQALGIAHRIPT